jgi:hypothetical protein
VARQEGAEVIDFTRQSHKDKVQEIQDRSGNTRLRRRHKHAETENARADDAHTRR